MIVHLGVVAIAVALAASGSYLQQTELRLIEGEPATFAGSTFTFVGTEVEVLPNRQISRVVIDIDGAGTWAPGISLFPFADQRIGTPSVRVTPTRDIALSVLSLPEGPGEPTVVRVTVQPLIVWLWIGGGIMALGTVLAALPGRRERARPARHDTLGAEDNPPSEPDPPARTDAAAPREPGSTEQASSGQVASTTGRDRHG